MGLANGRETILIEEESEDDYVIAPVNLAPALCPPTICLSDIGEDEIDQDSRPNEVNGNAGILGTGILWSSDSEEPVLGNPRKRGIAMVLSEDDEGEDKENIPEVFLLNGFGNGSMRQESDRESSEENRQLQEYTIQVVLDQEGPVDREEEPVEEEEQLDQEEEEKERERDPNDEIAKLRPVFVELPAEPRDSKGRRIVRKKSKKPIDRLCLGVFNEGCPLDGLRTNGILCNQCHDRQVYGRKISAFIGQMFGIKDAYYSSLNPVFYSDDSTCSLAYCGTATGLTFPFCTSCLKYVHKLRVGISIIPGAGLGLFVTENLQRGHKFTFPYGSAEMSAKEYNFLRWASDPLSHYKASYAIEFEEGRYLRGADENAGVLRFINHAPCKSLQNAEFISQNGKVWVRLIKSVPKDCELFLWYDYRDPHNVPFKLKLSAAERQQRIDVLSKTNQKHLARNNTACKAARSRP